MQPAAGVLRLALTCHAILVGTDAAVRMTRAGVDSVRMVRQPRATTDTQVGLTLIISGLRPSRSRACRCRQRHTILVIRVGVVRRRRLTPTFIASTPIMGRICKQHTPSDAALYRPLTYCPGGAATHRCTLAPID
eukprot:483341-Rhodomonas_salina.1